jgi:hypothetical protein
MEYRVLSTELETTGDKLAPNVFATFVRSDQGHDLAHKK